MNNDPIQCKKCGSMLHALSNMNTPGCQHEAFYPIFRMDLPERNSQQDAKIKNIIAFLLEIFSDDDLVLSSLFEKSPSNLLEKYERYIGSKRDESPWGMHPNLRDKVFNRYCEIWYISSAIEDRHE